MSIALQSGEKAMSEDRMTKEEFLASRFAAGQVIDVESCEINWWWAKIVDPCGVDPNSDPCVGRVIFVRSAESGGWVCDKDLPEDKWDALDARIKRGDLHDDWPF